MRNWLIKSEPYKYSWDQLVQDGSTFWDGVRNYQARNNLASMQIGELCLFYHSNEGKEVVGIARVISTSRPDPTADAETWVGVDVAPYQPLKSPVTLARIKSEPSLAQMGLLRQGRLSVVEVSREEFDIIVAISEE
ncbi:MAG: EVE domain-containing protein [Bacteroidetes bacterium]|nr:EVE domain-containing protein [Bacteroidota bacterium]